MKRTQWKIKRWWMIHISEHVEHFFYDHYGNGVAGPGYSSYREFKYGKVAFIISILTMLGIVLFLILK